MMRTRFPRFLILGAAAAALGSLPPPRTATADMLQTVDGDWVPKPKAEMTLGPDDEPNDDILRDSAENKVNATYEIVTCKGFNKPAGQVKRIFSTDRATNENFRKGLVSAGSNFFPEAAESFTLAAAECKDFGKQEALYYVMVAWSSAGDAEKTEAAIVELLKAFPKSYFFVDTAITRAKIAAGEPSAARKALDAVKSAPGMNTRDLLRAEYYRIFLTEESQKELDKAREDYLKLVGEIERSAAAEAKVTREMALVGIGNCFFRKAKPKEALDFYAKAAKESKNPDVLAGAYDGLGNIAFGEAKALQEAKKTAESKDKLEEAALHYLRVSLMYRNDVEDISPVWDALENQAKVFVALFDMSNGKDCESARRAYAAYFELQGILPDGIQKKRLVKEGIDFGERKKTAGCGG